MAEATEGLSTRVDAILSKPYSWCLVRKQDGSWLAEIREIPGCYATGKSREEAIAALQEHAKELLAVYLTKGQRIPPPVEGEFSGNFALRLPKDLHRRAAHSAAQNGVSLNQFIVAAVSEQVGYVTRPNLAHLAVSNFNVVNIVFGTTGPRISSTFQPQVPGSPGNPPKWFDLLQENPNG